MTPIDYSKWDNIDTDSEPEATSQSVPAPRVAPTSTSAPPPNTSGSIQAVIVRCEVERIQHMPWSSITIPEDHVVFSQTVPPVPALIEVPLVLHRVGTQSANRADLDNQIATYLNIDADIGFAPPVWQSHVGTVIVARKDRKPLLPIHLEGVWMFCDYILDLFGDAGRAPRHLYSRRAFEKWWDEYCDEQKEDRGGQGGDLDPDDWRAPKSLFDM